MGGHHAAACRGYPGCPGIHFPCGRPVLGNAAGHVSRSAQRTDHAVEVWTDGHAADAEGLPATASTAMMTRFQSDFILFVQHGRRTGKPIVIDPRISFGRPTVAGSGVSHGCAGRPL